MPLWQIHHPENAYSASDKQAFSEAITAIYTDLVHIPAFYVVVIFDEVKTGDMFVGAKQRENFVRLNIDQMARTLPGRVLREFWVHHIDSVIKPWVQDRNFDWEFTIDEPPADLWSLQGFIPPPFESVGEARWIEENKASAYTQAEQLPINVMMAPGTRESL
ncbi:tautomerase family protein [Arthrobacter sp. NPDC080031]|uniref:tautomerase family protein n=1 Tax=Arthrobacter sp. NPDC080031 TaxID=3155918 RepID=UPI00344DF83B